MDKFEKKNITAMDYMFNSCYSLEKIDLSKFDTREATSLYSTFSNCSLIKSLDTTCLNTSNINSMSYAFRNCSSLTSIDLSNFDFRKVEGIKGFFFRCSSLESVIIDNYEINASDMSEFFCGCSSLKNVTINVGRSIKVDRFFKECDSLEYIDLSKFYGINVTFYSDFFPVNVENATILYNSSIIGHLLSRIPKGWNKIDINNNIFY